MGRRKPKDLKWAEPTPRKSRKVIQKQWMRSYGKRRMNRLERREGKQEERDE